MSIYDCFELYNEQYKVEHISFDEDQCLSSLGEEDKRVYILIKNIIGLHENYRDSNIIFEPKIQWEDKRSFDISDLSKSDYDTLSTINLDRLPVAIRARIGDVLWVGNSNYQSAIKAIESYIVLFEKTYDNINWVRCANMISRALYIATQIGKNQKYYNNVCEIIKESLVKEDGKDPLFLSIVMLECLILQKYGNYLDYIDISNKIILNSQKQNKVEEAYRVKKQLLKWGKQSTHDCDMELVAYYELIANKKSETLNDLFNSIKVLEKAIHIARNNNEQGISKELTRKMEVLKKQISPKLKRITSTIDLKETQDQIVHFFNNTTFEKSILVLTRLVNIYKKEELKNKIEGSNSIINIFGISKIDKQGRTIIELPPLDKNNEHILELYMFKRLTELTDICGSTVVKLALQEINNNFKFDEKNLSIIFNKCLIVRPGREKILAKGFNMALHGMFYEALHILAPQAEDVFRYIAEICGGLVYTFEDNNTSNAKVLSSIFDIPELVDCYDPDYLFMFRGLLNEKAGSNIRNLIAHGIFDPDEANSGSSIYFCIAFFKMIVDSSISFFGKLKEDKNHN